MKKSQKQIQLILVSIGLLLIFITYIYYPNINKLDPIQTQPSNKDLITEKDGDNTYFENVEYQGVYDLSSPFILKSKKAYIKNEEPDIVYMTTMNVNLYLTDGRIVNITADKGSYNKLTYDCFFQDNVYATDGETKIYAQNLDLLATKNYVEIYNNVNLNYITGSLWADKINYDFETKNFKVSMFNEESVKVKLIK